MKERTPISVPDPLLRGAPAGGTLPRAGGGFSLVELLIALTLLIGILVLLPTRFSGGVAGAGLRGTAARVAAGLRLTRSLAISRGRDQRFGLDLERRHFGTSGRDHTIVLDPAITVKMTTAESERPDAAHASIRFFPDGSSTGGRIELTRGGRGFLIAVDWLTGRITVRGENPG